MARAITSFQNPVVRNVRLLREKPRERRKQGLFVIEGVREIRLAMESGFAIETLLYCPETSSFMDPASLTSVSRIGIDTVLISAPVFNRLAYREESGGVIAVARYRTTGLQDLLVPDNPLIFVLETVEKPGNLGAILRTADAAGVTAILVCDPQTDLFNPNVIRASLGTVFTNRVCVASSAESLDWLRENGFSIYSASLAAKNWYHQIRYADRSAIVMGSEAYGLSDFWLEKSDTLIKIPMYGRVDSLNVSASAAVLMFEVIRQRNR
jgi:TrmH family RNA methyltransferase